MVQAALLFLLGFGGSLVALVAGCAYLSTSAKGRYERSCQLQTYFDWVMRKGTANQKSEAEELKKRNDLEGIKKLVGYGILVDE